MYVLVRCQYLKSTEWEDHQLLTSASAFELLFSDAFDPFVSFPSSRELPTAEDVQLPDGAVSYKRTAS